MNIDTGEIVRLGANTTEQDALMRRLLPIEEKLMTEKQRAENRVSLRDHTSELGKQLTAARSIYVPHVGAKQLAKAALRGANEKLRDGGPMTTESK